MMESDQLRVIAAREPSGQSNLWTARRRRRQSPYRREI